CEVATDTDVANCGACGKMCGPVKNGTPGCAGGMCVPRCNPGFMHCSMNPDDGCEVASAVDAKNCGMCGNVCPVMGAHGQVACVNGACAISQCDFGYADCNKMAGDGCEVAVASDNANCGTCGNACGAVPNATASCTAGKCVIGMCNAGFAD